MIQIINTPAENRVLLDANNTEISIQSTNGAGFYFRALIYVDDLLFDEQGWSREDAYTAKKDLVKLNTGFTLIETFVAITILMIAILGPMSIIAKFYADSTYAKNQIASAFLAQDGMETILNLIRNNTENRRIEYGDGVPCEDIEGWLQGIDICENGCNVNSITGRVESCPNSNGGCQIVKSDGWYISDGLGDGSPTIFYRQVKIEDPDEPPYDSNDYSTLRRAAQVTSKVWWQEKGVRRGPVTVSSLVVQNKCP